MVPGEEGVDEPTQTHSVHDLRAQSVFHPKTVDISKVAADRDLVVPVPTGDQYGDQAIRAGRGILVPTPLGMITKDQPHAPRRADPAPDHFRLRCFNLHPDGRSADESGTLSRPDTQRTSDLLGGLSLPPQQAYTFETLIRLHADRS